MKKNINIKNYFILFFIFALTIVLFVLLMNVYKNNIENSEYGVKEIINELKIDEFESYSIEHDEYIILLLNENNDIYQNVDKKLKNYIINSGIKSDIVYINLNEEDYNKIKELLGKNLLYDFNVIYVKDGTINSTLYSSSNNYIKIEDIKNFIDKHLGDAND